ncbi:MAG: hypothetical protein WCK28_19210 [Burkholderiales bacterium]|jgi:hypothetical protein
MNRHAKPPAIVPSPNTFDFERASLDLLARLRRPVRARGAAGLGLALPEGDEPTGHLVDADNDPAPRRAAPGRLAA